MPKATSNILIPQKQITNKILFLRDEKVKPTIIGYDSKKLNINYSSAGQRVNQHKF